MERIYTEAAEWHAASAGDAMDWDGFTSWLEADPRHRAAYDEIALADALVSEHRGELAAALPPAPANDSAPDGARRVPWSRMRWLALGGGALAAALALVLAIPLFVLGQDQVYQTGTQLQQIALEDGASVTLAPHSKLTLKGGDARALALAGGAWFDIDHRPGRELTIQAGGLEVRDLGTRFDVQADAGAVRVGVAEGKVAVAGSGFAQPIELPAGKSLAYDPKAAQADITDTPPAVVGDWRKGQLTFTAAPLSLVAVDLARYAGVQVDLPDSLKSRRFSGTLASSDGQAALRDLAQLMGLQLVRTGDRYRLLPG